MNFYIGPSTPFLISHGVKYTPCMRGDVNIQLAIQQQNALEQLTYGCCQDTVTNQCGQTTQSTCNLFPSFTFQLQQQCPDTCSK